MSKAMELTGKTFGRLSVLSRYYGKTKYDSTYWECECQCYHKTKMIVRGIYLSGGRVYKCSKCSYSQNQFLEENDYMVCITSNGKRILFDKEDYPKISVKTWNACGRYVSAKHENRTMLFHRFVMDAKHGDEIDHINGDRYDNRKSNLRFCTRQENSFNRHHVFGASQYKGVSRTSKQYRRPWRATLKHNGKTITLGTFFLEEDAARAYDEKASELFGEFAKLNFDA